MALDSWNDIPNSEHGENVSFCSSRIQYIGSWDTSGVVSMEAMFQGAAQPSRKLVPGMGRQLRACKN